MKRYTAALFAVLAAGLCGSARSPAAGLSLDSVFGDHAVLQRGQALQVRGEGEPGSEVRVELAGHQARARVDASGRWRATLPALDAGGPYVLSAQSGSARVQAQDVLVGDVWLCSGQSNMELPVHRSLDSRSELANAAHEDLRLLAIAQESSPRPLERYGHPPVWRRSEADSLRDFSAACYYFARELQRQVKVPMGLIAAAWGGSRIQAWLSEPALQRLGGYRAELDVLHRYARDPAEGLAHWGRRWQDWWRQRPGLPAGDAPWAPQPPDAGWLPAPAALGPWERWGVPALSAFDGMLWYRSTVRLSAAQAAQPATLLLGVADEIDLSWVNGRAVGSSYGGQPRAYALRAGTLRAGDNLVVVNVLDTYREGGLSGPASALALRLGDGSRVALDGGWQYRPVPAAYGTPPRAPWQSAAGLSTLYHGMVMPLRDFGLRGALWYQGESNTFEAADYGRLLRAYRQDLRRQFGARLPLLVVQLAGYGAPNSQPMESDWALLREQQRQVAAEDALTGLAVAIDLGERQDIHPANKQELGRRLARAARHVVYGEGLAPSGPVARAAGMQHGEAWLAFADVERGLRAYGADGPIGFELCGAAAGSCRYAPARLDGNRVWLRAEAVPEARRVRYCWADSPVCTLYDGNGLPAGPFEIAIPLPSRGNP